MAQAYPGRVRSEGRVRKAQKGVSAACNLNSVLKDAFKSCKNLLIVDPGTEVNILPVLIAELDADKILVVVWESPQNSIQRLGFWAVQCDA